MEAAVTAYTAENPDGHLTPTNIANINEASHKCAGADSSVKPLVRLETCKLLIIDFLTDARQYNDQLAWDAAFELYWYTVGPKGLGPSVKAEVGQYLEEHL
jgi:hypothetical protein